MTETIVTIEGMMCGMCENHICDQIRTNFKVKKVTASHRRGQAVILSEEPVETALLKEKIGACGYTVTAVESHPFQKKKLFGLF